MPAAQPVVSAVQLVVTTAWPAVMAAVPAAELVAGPAALTVVVAVPAILLAVPMELSRQVAVPVVRAAGPAV